LERKKGKPFDRLRANGEGVEVGGYVPKLVRAEPVEAHSFFLPPIRKGGLRQAQPEH
jgi:hypothetical protein